MSGARYVLTLPNGRQIDDRLGQDGRLRVEGIPAGSCKIVFPDHGEEMSV